MTLVYFGPLASEHSHKPASPSRVFASCSTSLHCFFCLAQVCKHRLATVLPTLDCLCRSDHVGNCLIGLLVRFALLRARVPSYSVPVVPTRESTPRPEPEGVAGRVFGESQWSETASEGAAFLFNLAVGFVIGVCTCVTLCCAQRGGFSRDYCGCRAAQVSKAA